MEEQPIKNEGRNDLWHRGKQPFANMFVYFSCFQSIFGIILGYLQYFFVSLQSIYIINIEKFNK